MTRRIILLSGGEDSALVAQNLPPRHTGALFVDYGQPAAPWEREASMELGKALGINVYTMALEPGLELESMADEPGKPGPRIVPQRNLILIGLAANMVIRGEVYVGFNYDDRDDYFDCREPFLQGLGAILPYITLHAPLLSKRKKEIRDELDPDLAMLTVSCYTPDADGLPCEECDSCKA